jgi:hypothetical protein
MKKILIFILPIVLYSCDCKCDDSTDHLSNQEQCLQYTKSVYPESNVFPIKEKNYRFVVIKSDGEVLYVELTSSSNKKFTALHLIGNINIEDHNQTINKK